MTQLRVTAIAVISLVLCCQPGLENRCNEKKKKKCIYRTFSCYLINLDCSKPIHVNTEHTTLNRRSHKIHKIFLHSEALCAEESIFTVASYAWTFVLFLPFSGGLVTLEHWGPTDSKTHKRMCWNASHVVEGFLRWASKPRGVTVFNYVQLTTSVCPTAVWIWAFVCITLIGP